jgi:hypothetical protein
MNDTSTWIQKSERWQCVMHMETLPLQVAPRTEPLPIQRMGQFDRSTREGANS